MPFLMNMIDGGGDVRPNNSASNVTAASKAALEAAKITVATFLALARTRGFANGMLDLDPVEFLQGAELKKYLAATKVILAAQEVVTTVASTSTVNTGGTTELGVKNPTDYKWNLPPHSWSLPVRPMTLEPGIVNGTSDYLVDGTSIDFHNLRRGRLWFFGGAEEISTYEQDGTVTKLGAKAGAESDPTKASGEGTLIQADRKYGFQFLWNPSSVSSNVSRNDNVTPSSADRLKSVVGAFPGQETVSFSIVIDRINDFACLKNLSKGTGVEVVNRNLDAMSKYYTSGYPGEKEPFVTKLKNLLTQGTMADLEYLFKAINGGSDQWITLLGKPTANIGFLMPTLLGLVLGPSTTTNLSYVGWLTGLSMQHEMFTEDMIPLRTTVTINMDCFAGSGIVSS